MYSGNRGEVSAENFSGEQDMAPSGHKNLQKSFESRRPPLPSVSSLTPRLADIATAPTNFDYGELEAKEDLHHRIRTLEQDKVNLSNILRDVLWLQTYQGTGVNADIVHDHLNQIKAKYSLYNEHSVSNNPSSSSVSALCQAADDIRKKIEAHDCSVQSNGRHQESTFAERIASKVGRSSAWKSLSVEQENERLRNEVGRLRTRLSDVAYSTKQVKRMFMSLMKAVKPYVQKGENQKQYQETKQALERVQENLSQVMEEETNLDGSEPELQVDRLKEILQQVREQAHALKTELDLVKYERDQERGRNDSMISDLQKENKRLRKANHLLDRPNKKLIDRVIEQTAEQPIIQLVLTSNQQRHLVSVLRKIVPLCTSENVREMETLLASAQSNTKFMHVYSRVKEVLMNANTRSRKTLERSLRRCEELETRICSLEKQTKGITLLRSKAQSHAEDSRRRIQEIKDELTKSKSTIDHFTKSIQNRIGQIPIAVEQQGEQEGEVALQKRKQEASKRREQLEKRRKQLDAEAKEASELLAEQSKQRKKRLSVASGSFHGSTPATSSELSQDQSKLKKQGLSVASSSFHGSAPTRNSMIVRQRSLSNMKDNVPSPMSSRLGIQQVDDEDMSDTTTLDSDDSDENNEEARRSRSVSSRANTKKLARYDSSPAEMQGPNGNRGLQRRKTLSQWLLRSKLSEERSS